MTPRAVAPIWIAPAAMLPVYSMRMPLVVEDDASLMKKFVIGVRDVRMIQYISVCVAYADRAGRPGQNWTHQVVLFVASTRSALDGGRGG